MISPKESVSNRHVQCLSSSTDFDDSDTAAQRDTLGDGRISKNKRTCTKLLLWCGDGSVLV